MFLHPAMCPWQVGWHWPQNNLDSCFSIPEEVLVEESCRQAHSLVNSRICFILLVPSQDICVWNHGCECYVDRCFFFFMKGKKRKIISLPVKALHSYLKQRSFHIPNYFKTLLCCQSRSKNQDPYLVPIAITVLRCGLHTSNLQKIIPHLDSVASKGLWCPSL